MHHLGKRVRAHYAGSEADARLADRQPHAGTTPSTATTREPDAEAVLREINGYDVRDRRAGRRLRRSSRTTAHRLRLLDLLRLLRRTASTRRAAATPGDLDAPGAAGSRPSGRGRGRPTAASSTTAPRPTREGKPWSERKKLRLVGRGRGQVGRLRRARLPGRQARRTTAPRRRRQGHGRDRRRRPVHHDGRRPGLAVRARRACSTARCRRTTSRSSRRSTNPLYPEIERQPGGADAGTAPDNPMHAAGDPRYPLVATTYRLTEHHTAGGDEPLTCRGWPSCSRRCSPRSTRCSRAERGIEDGGWMVIETAARGDRGARARHRAHAPAAASAARSCTRSALPWHWGFGGAGPGRQRQRPRRARGRPERRRSRRPRRSPATSAPAARDGEHDAKLAGVRARRHASRPTRDAPAEDPAHA